MPRYFLARDAFLCVCDDQIIILELTTGRYLALPTAEAAHLKAYVEGWPAFPGRASGTKPIPEDSALQSMLERGLLTETPSHGKKASPVTIIPASRNRTLRDDSFAIPIRFSHIVHFVSAYLSSVMRIRFLPIRHVVRQVARRKPPHGEASGAPDSARTLELVTIFHRLRPFMFTARDACLFDSLTLITFLRRYGIDADWVFGVKANPFSAHCWVQVADTPMNDYFERVSAFTPIMAV